MQNLTLSHRMVEKLWLPNVCIINSKGSLIHHSPTPNVFLAILPNGTVWINYRLCDSIFLIILIIYRNIGRLLVF